MSENEPTTALEAMALKGLGAGPDKLPSLGIYDAEITRVLVDASINWIYSGTSVDDTKDKAADSSANQMNKALIDVIEYDGIQVIRTEKVDFITTGRGTNSYNNKTIKIIYIPNSAPADIDNSAVETNYIKEFDCLPHLAIINTAINMLNKIDDPDQLVKFVKLYDPKQRMDEKLEERIRQQFKTKNMQK